MILLWIVIPILLLYTFLIIYYTRKWNSASDFAPSDNNHKVKVSVVIPARNEEHTIVHLLNAIRQQTYPADLIETIVVDDHSGDKTAEIVKQYPEVRLIRLKEEGINSYKKKAIETGIAAATGEWIVATDADCLPPERWLQTMVSFKEEKQSKFIAAPVVIDCNASLVQMFQALAEEIQ